MKKTILAQPEYATFREATLKHFEAWKAEHMPTLGSIREGTDPKGLIHLLSENLLDSFDVADLLDKYDIYQILMSYWADVMQDDVYLLEQYGWKAASSVRALVPIIVKKNGKDTKVYKEEAHFEFGTSKNKVKYRSDIIEPDLVVARFFADEKLAFDAAILARDEASQALESFIEDNSGEDSLIVAAQGDNGNYAQAEVKRQIKQVQDADEVAALKQLLALQEAEGKAKSAAKAAKLALDQKVFDKIPLLSEQECMG